MELVDRHLPKGELVIAPIGDIQYGSQGCAEDMLKAHVKEGIDQGWWFLGMGDYLDTMSPGNRKALVAAKASLYDSARQIIDEAVHNRVTELAQGCLAGTEGRWLGMVEGDHLWVDEQGQPCDHLLAQKLKAPYLGHSAIVSVYQKGVDRPLRIFVTHGAGSSVSATGKTLHLERLLSAFQVDIVLMGHSHLKYAVPVERIKPVTVGGGSDLFAEKKIVGITGSFLKGYEANTRSSSGVPAGGYVEQKALRPVALGAIRITAKPVQHEWGWEWDLAATC